MRTLRSIGGLAIVCVVAALVVLLLVDAVIRGGWAQMLLLAPWPLLVLWATYEAAAASYVRMDDGGVTVQNMLRRTSFGWRRLRGADFRWQVEFALDDDTTVTALGGPARSRPRRQTVQEREVEGERVPTGVRVLTEISDRRDRAGVSADAPIRRSWDVPALAALGIIALWIVAAVLIAQS
ncbi:PH domain-containing protein [Microbacterium sp. NPDC056234]|uniref:PH domain-containing protein n=1 Tax=Microbacterium sp. NPDC056234 TaxID=3345757 RepID=UPI0035DE5DB5